MKTFLKKREDTGLYYGKNKTFCREGHEDRKGKAFLRILGVLRGAIFHCDDVNDFLQTLK